MSATQQTLAQLIRSKYPDSYKDMSDTDLESAVVKKYPQYSSLPRTPEVMPNAAPQPQASKGLLGRLNDWWTKPQDVGQDPYTLGKLGYAPSIKESPREGASSAAKLGMAATIPSVVPAAIAAPGATLLGLGGSAAGGYVGGAAGRYLGEQVGAPEIGEDLGSVAGGVAGGYGASKIPSTNNAVASALRNPATARQSQLGRPGAVKNILPPFLQKYTVPEGLIPKGDVGTPTNPGPFMEVPARLKTTQPPTLPPPKPSPFLGMTPSSKPLGNASLPKVGAATVPEEPQFVEKFSPPPTQPGSDISQLPEPIQRFSNENPGYMASVPRKQLLELAGSGKLGAGEQLQQIGQRVLYTPRGVISGEKIRLPWESGGPSALQGKPLPFAGPPQISEKAATLSEPRKSLGPEFESQQREEMISRYKSILRDPRRTPMDESEANARLRELGAI